MKKQRFFFSVPNNNLGGSVNQSIIKKALESVNNNVKHNLVVSDNESMVSGYNLMLLTVNLFWG